MLVILVAMLVVVLHIMGIALNNIKSCTVQVHHSVYDVSLVIRPSKSCASDV